MKRNSIISTFISLIILISFGCIILLKYPYLEESIPIHFDIYGNPTDYSNKSMIIVLYVISISVLLLLIISEKFPNKWNLPVNVTDDNRDYVYFIGSMLIAVLKVFVSALFSYIGLLIIYPSLPFYVVILLTILMVTTILICMFLMRK